ncbi:MAG: DUF1501 domain-containing protein [Planctomycetales bacterium]|nr:DUF1501 domain-containing protein [Planctomycetales bacterium]
MTVEPFRVASNSADSARTWRSSCGENSAAHRGQLRRRTGHWPRAGFARLSEGGFRTGQVIGQTNTRAKHPTSKAYYPQNVFATPDHFLGIDPDQSTYRHPAADHCNS